MLKTNKFIEAYLNVVNEDINQQQSDEEINQFIDTLYEQIKSNADKLSNWLKTIPSDLVNTYFLKTIDIINIINDKNLFQKKVYKIFETLINDWKRLYSSRNREKQIYCYFGFRWDGIHYSDAFDLYDLLQNSTYEYVSKENNIKYPSELYSWDKFIKDCYNFINNYVKNKLTNLPSNDCLGHTIDIGDHIVIIRQNDFYFGTISDINSDYFIIDYTDNKNIKFPKYQSYKLLDLSKTEQIDNWFNNNRSIEI